MQLGQKQLTAMLTKADCVLELKGIAQIFQKSRIQLKIIVSRMVAWGSKVLGVTTKNLVTMATLLPGIVHPCT